MELNAVKDAFDRVSNKQKLSYSKSQEVIERMSHEIKQALSRMQSDNDALPRPDYKLILSDLKTKLKEIAPVSQLEGTWKELNVALKKYPKLLKKSFNPDMSKAYRNVDLDIHMVNQIIASHFYRDGLFDIGDCFIDEAREPEYADKKSPFFEMHKILEAMKSRDLEPALNWASTNLEKLNENGSDIELKLHCLQFMEILQKRGRDEALKYAIQFLTPFAAVHMAEIQKLIACLLWAGRLNSSAYSELLSLKLAEELSRQFCYHLGQSYESPLSVTIAAGVQGLPTLLMLMNVKTVKQQEWQSMKHLPVPVDLGREVQFHSIFLVCTSSKPGPGQ